MIDLVELLFKRYCDKKLAHFYILNAPSNTENSHLLLEEWIHRFLSKVLIKEKDIGQTQVNNIFELGHSDILELKKETPQANYLVEDFSEFLRFQNYYNFELPHRFIIIHNAQNMSANISNKLLKTLEEPQAGTTIFFLNSSNQNFIPTIESRAISLTLMTKREELLKDNKIDKLSWLASKMDVMGLSSNFKKSLINFVSGDAEISEVTAMLKKDKELQKKLILLIMDFECTRNSDLLAKEEMLKELQWFEKAQAFNNPAWERFLGPLVLIKA
ncbi:MAG: hypothetical protein KAG61_07870 [Bacteriovoracaceae bacterium]|nr:hypothetical protein [Bacteriovoracaceae bacterium]